MKFAEFEAHARQEWDRIPHEFRTGVDGLIVERDARSHPRTPGVYTLGECTTESYPSDYGGPDTTRSAVVLYYGSFRRLAGQEPEFDWEREIWETLTHELQHHLESLAAESGLEDVDEAVEQNLRRQEGEPFDPLFYLAGERTADGWYRLEDSFFLEAGVTDGPVDFDWAGRRYRLRIPAGDDDVTFVTIEGVDDAPTEMLVVVTRAGGALARLRAWFGRRGTRVGHTRAMAEKA